MDLKILKNNLENRGFIVNVFDTAEEAALHIDSKVDGASVAIGGSVTVLQMGLYEKLKTHNTVWWSCDKEQLEKYKPYEIREKSMSTDVYISSANGVSEAGDIVNIDGLGNRIASTCYGHKRLIYVIGQNKICKTLEKAIWRARNIAAPQNAKRLERQTPCALKADKCYNCNSPERICRGVLITERPFTRLETEVVLIKQDLGL